MPRKSVLIVVLAAATVMGGLLYWTLSENETAVLDAETHANDTTTIANEWQWNKFATTQAGDKSERDQPRSQSVVPNDAVKVYKILQSIKLDENGRVLPDQTLKQALEEGFDELGPNLNPAAMSELQRLIRVGLPGPAGEDAAGILSNYYQFRLAEVQFNRELESSLAIAGSNARSKNQALAVSRHEELLQLRRGFLSQEVADKLFAVEDTQARHMFDAIAIQQNPSLSAEEKLAQQGALQEQLNNRLLALRLMEPEEAAAEKVQRLRDAGASSVDIHSSRAAIVGVEHAGDLAAADREEGKWQSRFNGFWQARRYVMQAGLDEAERERQIDQLVEQYFNPDERERARATSSDWQARDPK